MGQLASDLADALIIEVELHQQFIQFTVELPGRFTQRVPPQAPLLLMCRRRDVDRGHGATGESPGSEPVGPAGDHQGDPDALDKTARGRHRLVPTKAVGIDQQDAAAQQELAFPQANQGGHLGFGGGQIGDCQAV